MSGIQIQILPPFVMQTLFAYGPDVEIILTSVFVIKRALTKDSYGNLEGEYTDMTCPLAVVYI